MKPLTARLHGYLDYLTVLIFLAAPSVLGFGGVAAKLAWLLAGVHLAMTLVTKFPLGVFRRLAFTLHGWVERIVGPALIAVAFLPDIFSVKPAFAFFAGMGLVIIAVGWLTDYVEAG
ncbi:hypothetical protein [Methylocystis hirsuta]|uniref:Uncharacterized protein n=1 Tax=Methylocystis hirsuta TaxID=369798 RepID=A0A3M9XLP8_9HYPH|nr:hypothetical protein [Methylocystis hirsuta]RNJ49199.1 hypothetical protein D1O30_05900 [Methylocystis hirsuta]